MLEKLQVEGLALTQAWDIPESTGCTELEPDAESSLHHHLTSIRLSKNRGTPKWMVYNGRPCQNG